MMVYNVFGRFIGVNGTPQGWQVFRVDITERKFSRLHDVVIPDFISAAEIPGWLGDIYHEAAGEKHPDVRRIE